MRIVDKLLSVQQVADIFGVATSSIWRWVKDGVLPKPVKVGGRTRWVKSEIHAEIERRKATRAKTTPTKKRTRVRLDDTP